jgi:hypothetical protein
MLASIEKNFDYFKTGVNTLLFGNLILNILLSSSIQMLWGTINTLQLIVLVTLFNLSYPDNAMFAFKLIAKITRFSIIPVDKIINAMFTFDESLHPINYNFKMMGYETTNILQTLDFILAFVLGIAALMVVTLLMHVLVALCPR